MMSDIEQHQSDQPALASPHGSNALTIAFAIGLFLAAMFVFRGVRDNDLVNWDDYRNLVETTAYRHLTAENVQWMLTTRQLAHWQPVIWMSYAFDYKFWGRHPDGSVNPRGFHTTNLLIHALTVVVFFLVVKRILEAAALHSGKFSPQSALRGAAVAAAVFGLHPLRTESVAWVTDRLDVFATFWYLLTLLIYLHKAPTSTGLRGGWLIVAMATYLLAIGSKSIVMTLPVILIVLDFYPLRRLGAGRRADGRHARGVWLEKIPFLGMGFGAGLLGLWAKSGPGLVSLEEHGFLDRSLQAFVGVGFYLFKTLCPQKMIPLYQIIRDLGRTSNPVVLAVGFTLIMTVILIAGRRKWPWALAAWICYLVTLAPVLGFTQSGLQVVADRYTYLGCLSLAVLAGGGAMHLFQRMQSGRMSWDTSALVFGLIGLVLLAFSAASRHQARVWANSASLWRHTLKVDPRNDVAMTHFGMILHEEGQSQQGEAYLRQAINLKPKSPSAHANLAKILTDKGAADEAVYHYQEALRFNPSLVLAMRGLADVYLARGQVEDATQLLEQANQENRGLGTISDFYKLAANYMQMDRHQDAVAPLKSALRIAPDEPALHLQLGICMMRTGQRQAAVEAYETALELDPMMSEAMVNLANVYTTGGHFSEAVKWYDKALVINPNVATTYLNYGLVLREQGDLEPAEVQFRKAIELDPQLATAYHVLAEMLVKKPDQRQEAVELWKKAIDLKDQEYPEALRAIVKVLTAEEKFAESVDYLKTAIRLQPRDVESIFLLGICYSSTDRPADAIKTLREGIRLAPNQPDIGNSLAWLLATTQQDDLRDGAEAVRLAEHFHNQAKEPLPKLMDTLAAAYAEVGDFDKAVETAEKAVGLLPKEGFEAMADQMKARLELYKIGKPCRE
jgi:tetratricopeptide (TPR) repeat protein